jgi:uncharacterized protein YjbI with pentapeptide repeats/alpha-tubulin suppressor-like RCC1 family protein
MRRNILLVDDRIQRYDLIVSAVDDTLAIPIVFNFYNDSIDDVKTRILEACVGDDNANGVTEQRAIGLLQHHYSAPTYRMLCKMQECIVDDIINVDPGIDSWIEFRDFVRWCKMNTAVRITHFDMMACSLYSDLNWKYIIDTLEGPFMTNVVIRASIDDTGSQTLGGNWFLETHAGVNLKTVYFTDAIDNFAGTLHGYSIYVCGCILANGQVKLWGLSRLSNMGSLSSSNISTPQTPNELTNVIAKKLLFSNNCTFVLDASKNLYASGSQPNGEFGVGNTTSYTSFSIIQTNVDNVYLTDNCSFIIKNNKLYASGRNIGQFGNGVTSLPATTNVFIEITTLSNINNISQIEVTFNSTMVVYNDGSLYIAGQNNNGELGNGNTSVVSTFTLHPTLSNIKKVFMHLYRSVFLKNNGDIHSCGFGAVAHSVYPGSVANTTYSTPVFCYNVSNVKWIDTGGYTVIILKEDGTVLAHGTDQLGQLGSGSTLIYSTLTTISHLTNVKMIFSSNTVTFYLFNDGTIKGAGTPNAATIFGDSLTYTTSTTYPSLKTVFGITTADRLSNDFLYSVPPTITNFANISITTLDSPYTLTDPSSNSIGAFSYASSSALLGTFSGNVFTILDVGTATITATQAINAGYDTGTITATITVSGANFNAQNKLTQNYTNKNLRNGSFVGTNFTGSTFSGADVSGANFTSATLTNIIIGSPLSNLSRATLPTGYYARNNYIIGPSVVLQSAALSSQDLSNISLAGCDLSGANLANAILIGCDISGTNFTNATLTGITSGGMLNTNSSTIRFSTGYKSGGGYILGPNFITRSANLSGMNLTGVSFNGSDISGSNLTNAVCRGVNFTGATITNVNFTNTDISNATIAGLTFSEAQKLQLSQNPNNAGIAAIQVASVALTTLTSLNAAIKVSDLKNVTSVALVTPDINGVVTITPSLTSAFYISTSSGQEVTINGMKYSSSNGVVVDANNTPVSLIKVGAVLYKVYAGSIIGVPVDPNYYKIKTVGIGDILIESGLGSGNVGPTGATGPSGVNGMVGSTGPTGPAGRIGITGSTGVYGVTGLYGITGPTGPVGATGSYGLIGSAGPTGVRGITGSSSSKGDTGSTGSRGVTGATGVQGPQGVAAAKGDTGIKGITGPTGQTGAQVAQGDLGATGTNGPTGTNAWNYVTNYTNGAVYYDLGRVSIQKTGIDLGYMLDVSGSIKAASINNISDYRIKTNVMPLESRIKMTTLRPVMYNNILRGDAREYGFIAHEVQKYFPELVTGEKDADNTHQAIMYNQMFALCVDELNHLNERVDMLSDNTNKLHREILEETHASK